jgi:A/G-specific adenine glycosylase
MKLAQALQKRHGRLPSTRRDIEELPGVGQYIANAIELIAFGTPRPLLDVNMARVLERYFGPRNLADIRYDPYLLDLAQGVVECDESLSLNWAVLDLGAMICTLRSPACPACPLRRGCKYARGISCARNDLKFLAASGNLVR